MKIPALELKAKFTQNKHPAINYSCLSKPARFSDFCGT